MTDLRDDPSPTDLTRALHRAVDDVPVSGDGWIAIQRGVARHSRRSWWRAAAPVAAAVAAVAAFAVVPSVLPGDSGRAQQSLWAASAVQGVDVPVWPLSKGTDVTSASLPSWQKDPAETARRFVMSLGVSLDGLTLVPGDSAGKFIVRSTGVDLRGDVATVEVGAYPGSDVMGVLRASSTIVELLGPGPNARLDPPLAVTFSTSIDAESARVMLFRTGSGPAIGETAEDRVDADTRWTSNMNFAAADGTDGGFVCVVVTDRSGAVRGFAVRPLALGGRP